MKKYLALTLAIALLFSLIGCQSPTEEVAREISCYDLADVYSRYGFEVYHGEHNKEGASSICDVICRSANDTLCFSFYFTEEDAIQAHEKGQYSIVLWFYSAIMGESRWLHCDRYGKIAYTYYDKNSLAPLNLLKNLEVM